MATLAPISITRLGGAPAYTAAAGGGDQVIADGQTFLHVKNASGSPITVTVVAQQSVAPNVATVVAAVSVPATTGERMIGPLPPSIFADGSGNCQITYSGVTSLTIAAFRLSQP